MRIRDEVVLELQQHGFEAFVFLLELSNELVLLVFIDDGLTFDLFGLVSVFQSAETFVVIVAARRQGADHQRFRIAAYN